MGSEYRAPTAAWGQQLKETPWAPSLQDLHIGKGVTAARSAPEHPPSGQRGLSATRSSCCSSAPDQAVEAGIHIRKQTQPISIATQAMPAKDQQ